MSEELAEPQSRSDMSGILKSFFGKKDEPAGGNHEEVMVSGSATPAVATVGGGEPVHVTDDTFQEMVLQAPVPVMVDFWAPWCGPCRMVAPIVEDLADKYAGRAVVAKINTDENLKVPGQFGIMGIPTLILFKDGQEVDRVVGFAPGQTLENKLKAVLG
jgi:thioredoxin 1